MIENSIGYVDFVNIHQHLNAVLYAIYIIIKRVTRRINLILFAYSMNTFIIFHNDINIIVSQYYILWRI